MIPAAGTGLRPLVITANSLSPAESSASSMAALPVCPESSMTMSSAPGQACASSQAVIMGLPRSLRPWTRTPGMPLIGAKIHESGCRVRRSRSHDRTERARPGLLGSLCAMADGTIRTHPDQIGSAASAPSRYTAVGGLRQDVAQPTAESGGPRHANRYRAMSPGVACHRPPQMMSPGLGWRASVLVSDRW
jgi:hypothetical protein